MLSKITYPEKIIVVKNRVEAAVVKKEIEYDMFFESYLAYKKEVKSPSIFDNRGIFLPLHSAVKDRNLELVKVLIDQGLTCFSTLRNCHGDTAADLARYTWECTEKPSQQYDISAEIAKITIKAWIKITVR